MDSRNALFGRGPRAGGGLPGRQVSGQAPPPAPRDYGAPPQDYNSYGAPSPNMNRQPQRMSGGYGGGGAGATARAIPLSIEKLPNGHEFIFRNLSAVCPDDFPTRDPGADVYVLLRGPFGEFVVTARPLPGFPRGKISLAEHQRSWMGIALQDQFTGEVYDPFSQGKRVYLGTMDLDIAFARSKMTDVPYDQDKLAEEIARLFQNQMFSPGQKFLMDAQSIPLMFTVKSVNLVDLSMEKGAASGSPNTSDRGVRGILTNVATINFFKDAKSPIKLKGSARRVAANAILAPDFKFEDLGIGGLGEEFETIFRRAFASRLVPPGIIAQMGIEHVRGMLLHGPPGTGKTLIARQLSKMLNAREPKIINGPEILNKFVGQSEENVRKMFADAEKEYKEKGDESGLHVIIFDELDAVCKQRGSGAGGGTGVGDSVVNQLLTKLDGVEALNNILLIGMTNRKDMIDSALLRPGRLEVHVEISLPDENGRQEIFKIRTAEMRKSNRMDDSVSLEGLAKLTKNFSGAEIAGVVKAASAIAFARVTKLGKNSGGHQIDYDAIRVTMDDFTRAVDDIEPAFGATGVDFENIAQFGIMRFSNNIERILNDGQAYANLVQTDSRQTRLSLLLYGPDGSGKTSVALEIARRADFPFIKLVTADDMLELSEQAKIGHLKRIFSDAHKSPNSCIILDGLETIIEWTPVGLRFQNGVQVAMAALMGKNPPRGKRLLVIATTSRREAFKQFDVLKFDHETAVPAVRDVQELEHVLSERGVPAQDVEFVANEWQEIRGTRDVGIGVKKVLAVAGAAFARAGAGDGRAVGQIIADDLLSLDVY
ncbi:P-loop containing nucleoside triphosphate hydrolase protein [Truncatella angustata]|uniref:Vesicular-fusion protein SEC18 n=1 Tax=Truncatella angustata TaxID=152316 RepID=A0A9P8UQA5_9PEZI|nr:P-loop containing nucleoside triphosphate hydrolase protein [Truncatella angustata]KAH6656273.1 P-loop containing nucleoside triphosphate hydrolase protein [Truncatella angustata]KAH8199456.1 hypothetical protein TruAng_006394 [Truncatella angustata]